MMTDHDAGFERYSFPTLSVGQNETPPNLYPLLYRGGAGHIIKKVRQVICEGSLGQALENRTSLIEKLHEMVNSYLIEGHSGIAVLSKIRSLRIFIDWCDNNWDAVSLDNLEIAATAFGRAMLHDARAGIATLNTISKKVSAVCSIVDDVTSRTIPLANEIGIMHSRNKRTFGTKLDMDQCFSYGRFLHDICRALPNEVIRGRLPITIKLRDGGELQEWCGLTPPEKLTRYNNTTAAGYKRDIDVIREAYMADTSNRRRRPLLNLRIEAELQIFIAETGMTLAPAFKLVREKYSFQTVADGLRMSRIFKDRGGREIIGLVHSEYREHFNQYLKWLDETFEPGQCERLFPITSEVKRADFRAPKFNALRKRCEKLQRLMIGPRHLRNSKVNFFIRDTRDTNIAAEMAQHTTRTLLRNYNRPSHQLALIEISAYHSNNDLLLESVGPGTCNEPNPIQAFPHATNTPIADCNSPSGCLFCIQHRDILSEEHTWSLMSFRHLKIMELSSSGLSAERAALHPAHQAISRLSDKLKGISEVSAPAKIWVDNSATRIQDGNYHPKWAVFIKLRELAHD